MPIPLTNGPGVYIQELPNPVQPIVGVPTSVAAFYGFAPQGQPDYPFQVNSWGDYQNEFGGLDSDYPLSYAVYLFFLNGGTTALVVRYNDQNAPMASVKLSDDITLEASSRGAWGGDLWAAVDQKNMLTSANQFNLTISQIQGSTTVAQEIYAGANLIKGTPQYLPTLLAASQLVVPTSGNGWTEVPDVTPVPKGAPSGALPGALPGVQFDLSTPAASSDTTGRVPDLGDPNRKTGIYALAKADIFNILCLPVGPATTYDPSDPENGLPAAVTFCVDQRAMLIVDPPSQWTDIPLQFARITEHPALTSSSPNAAVYYPNLVITDSTSATFNAGPCGAVAGVWAATDSSRGVWKAPAGTAATITGITDFAAPGPSSSPPITVHVDDSESGILNPLAVNALRTMPAVGPVVWGTRTTVGADQLQNQWKYLPVRRLALYIEESLRRGTQWAVFEPNDEPLWSSLRLNVTTFMQGLFGQGAFEGTTPAQAYLVQCDANNNPQAQIDLGIVNILVGFAPLYPAEFVIINIQQQAGQA